MKSSLLQSLIIAIFILVTLSLFSNEIVTNKEDKKLNSFSFQFMANNTKSDISKQLVNLSDPYSLINAYAKGLSKYKRHLVAGITMMSVGGFLFFILSPVFIGCGVFLITFTKQKVAYAGTTSQYYYYEAPYQNEGIALAVFGGIFFFTAIGLIIAGAINFGLAYKAKKSNANLKNKLNRLTFISNYDIQNNRNEIGARYVF